MRRHREGDATTWPSSSNRTTLNGRRRRSLVIQVAHCQAAIVLNRAIRYLHGLSRISTNAEAWVGPPPSGQVTDRYDVHTIYAAIVVPSGKFGVSKYAMMTTGSAYYFPIPCGEMIFKRKRRMNCCKE